MAAHDTLTLSREELYRQIWTEPISRVAPKLGISDVGLAKICRRMRIPVPARGYWAKVWAGRRVRRPPLPKGRASDACEIVIRQRVPKEETSAREGEHPLIEQERDPGNRIAVSGDVADLHPFVERARRSLRNARADERGALQPRTIKCIDLQVSPNSLERALRILDAMFKAFDTRGWKVTLSTGDRRQTQVNVLEEEEVLRLEEKVRQIALPPKDRWGFARYDYVSTGTLCLRILNEAGTHIRRRWQDGEKQKIEECLNSFMAGIVRTALAIKEDRDERERREQEWMEAERRRAEELERRLEQKRRVETLEEMVAAWEWGQRTRAFLAHVRESDRRPAQVNGDGFEVWWDWANEYAASLESLDWVKADQA